MNELSSTVSRQDVAGQEIASKKRTLAETMVRPAPPRGLWGVMDRVLRFLRSSPTGAISLLIWLVLIFVAIFAAEPCPL